ncbi:MAG: hypothetical protein CMJ94_04295 [Planctomycetes bacterium]|nr:hypothetical protein [Planctomycetota bacterium]
MFAILALVSAWAAPAQDWKDLAKELHGARDGYEVAQASRAFAEVRDPAAMQERVEIFEDKLEIRGGVHLRDWLISGMISAETADETEVLLEAAAHRKASALLRVSALRALRRGKAPVSAEHLLDRAFLKTEGELRRAWQNTAGAVLAQGRLIESRKATAAAVRARLLDDGMPFLGFRWVAPEVEELSKILDAAKDSKHASDRAQLLHVLAPHLRQHAEVRAAWLELLARAVASGSLAERVAAWESTLAGQAYEAFPILLQGLQRASAEDQGSRHQRDYAQALRQLTGQQFGDAPQAWDRWWAESGQSWLESAIREAPKAPKPAAPQDDATVAAFFGIPVDSNRIGFVLDGSGSMLDPLEDGRRCADAAIEELIAFLDRYPQDALFQLRIIVRDSESPFDEPVQASARNRKKALQFIERFDFGPASAMYDVLLLAQQDHGIDTLVFVSDGGGSWGSYAFAPHMLDGLQLAYERSGVRIHTICVGKSAPKARFMEQLAGLTRGICSRID